jgi:hypothetical protein
MEERLLGPLVARAFTHAVTPDAASGADRPVLEVEL